MSELQRIREPVDKELREFEAFFKDSMKTRIPLLSIITNYIYRRKGKQLRPLLVFLTAGTTGAINQSTYVAAAMIELLHTATLIHDDVVDEAYERRGSFSINALWRSKVAVLVGDFLLSKGLLLAIETNEFELLRNMSSAVKEMSEGELLQIERSRKMDVNEDVYLEIIRKKTATLLSSCATNGACSAGATNEQIKLAGDFGMYLGMAFQLKDDIFDYQPKGIIGKPTGNDIKEKKLTLPLIHALGQVGRSEQLTIRSLVRKSRNDSVAHKKVLDFVGNCGGIEYTQQVMSGYINKAKGILLTFPKSNYRDALEQLSDFTMNRLK